MRERNKILILLKEHNSEATSAILAKIELCLTFMDIHVYLVLTFQGNWLRQTQVRARKVNRQTASGIP